MPDIPVSQIESAAAAKHDEAHCRVVADGRADIFAGRIVTPQSIDEWIVAVGTAYERPLPQSTAV